MPTLLIIILTLIISGYIAGGYFYKKDFMEGFRKGLRGKKEEEEE